MKRLFVALCVAILGFGASQLQASVIRWTLHDVTFDDGATLTGSFDIENFTGYSTVFNLTASSGTLSAFTYTGANSEGYHGTNNFQAFDSAVGRYLTLNVAYTLNVPKSVNEIILVQNSGVSYECSNCFPVRYIASGYISSDAEAVPEPALVGLFGLGAIGLATVRRRPARG